LDFRYNQSNKASQFPGPLADTLTVYVPLAFFWLVGNFFGPKGDAHAISSMYLLAMALKIFVVESAKNYAGEIRPTFFSVSCDFNSTRLDCGPDGPDIWGYESFPSGHAATAMTAATIWSMYDVGKIVGLSRQWQHLNQRYWAPSCLVKVLLILACTPMLLGMYISISRFVDDQHHPADVLAGMLLGVGTALLAHPLYYPSIFGPTAGIPRVTLAEIRETPQHQGGEEH
jgi:diacylglycerol diphosphate phosphatase / phosphatidate phosphatase